MTCNHECSVRIREGALFIGVVMAIRGKGKFGLVILWADLVKDIEWYPDKATRQAALKKYKEKLKQKLILDIKERNR